ncbi:ankyrin repeat-containing domain protein [Apiospora marii]|uniref:protein S-acyltransferase n=1 Tax=Apiospora marii TaxID=335849 RepID=A0ABR1RHX1_9PEZI
MASFLDTTLISDAASGLELMPIHQAALCGHASVVAYLLEKGADVNASTANGLTSMHLAKTGGVVHLLADHGGRLDQDETAASGVSNLISSISHQCEASAVAAFLELGADPNQVDQNGRTAAEVAIVHGNANALGALVDSGVDLNKPLPSGGFLLYKAIWLGARDHSTATAKTMATMLLDRGASPNCGLDETLGPRHGSKACHTPVLFLAVMMRGSADLVQLLLERGADQFLPYTEHRGYLSQPKERTIRGFDEAYSKSLVANVVAGIVDCGTYPEDPDAFRKLELLVQYGGDMDAAIHGHLRLQGRAEARRLVQWWSLYGYDSQPEKKVPAHTPLQWCLLQDGSRAEKAVPVIRHLAAVLGANVHRVDAKGDSPFHLLCGPFYHQHQQGYLQERVYRGSYWRSSLLWSSRFGPPLFSLIDVFVDQGGADPNVRDARGRTPLMLLCRHAHTVPTALMIDVLLRHRAVDTRAVDGRGYNALHYATGEPADPFHHESCLRLQVLLSRGREGGGGGGRGRGTTRPPSARTT